MICAGYRSPERRGDRARKRATGGRRRCTAIAPPVLAAGVYYSPGSGARSRQCVLCLSRRGFHFFFLPPTPTPELVAGGWFCLCVYVPNSLPEALSTTSGVFFDLHKAPAQIPILFAQGVRPFHFRPFPSRATGWRLHGPSLTSHHFFVRGG
jgi:hypothetical protein